MEEGGQDEARHLAPSSATDNGQSRTFHGSAHRPAASQRGGRQPDRGQTRRGRAELRLAERAAVWNAKPENRHLPAWWEWLNVRLCTLKQDWTEPQRRMMRQAGRYHGKRGLLLTFCLLVGAASYWYS
jgi:hypothetical protein